MTIVCLDLETTGLDKKKDSIIEVALVRFDEHTFEILDTFDTLVNPWIPIPALNSSITNIYDEDVRGKPMWWEISEKVRDFIADSPVLWHNIAFDIWFLSTHNIDIVSNPVIDTFNLSNFLVLGEKSLSLEYLCKYFKIQLNWAHRALNDVMATIKVFQKCTETIINKSPKHKAVISYIFSNSHDLWYDYLRKTYLEDYKNVSYEDFITNIVQDFPKSKVIKKRKHETEKIEFDENFLSEKLWLEVRENQKLMTQKSYETFEEWELTAIEAPTWVWKTFAYLLPAIIYSLNTWEQVFVSTSTKALQDQIFYKDLEFLANKLEFKFDYAKLKWKKNYLSLSALLSLIQEQKIYEKPLATFILKIFFWIRKTKNWELDELDFYWQEFSYLFQISADDFFTFSNENPYYEQEFAVQARKQARNANIVVINNSILFQDIDSDNSILSKVENLVLDEAHNLEDVATDALKKSITILDIEKNFTSLVSKLKKEKVWVSDFQHQADSLLFEIWIIFDYFKLYILRKNHKDSKYKQTLVKQDFFEIELKEYSTLHLDTLMRVDDYLDLIYQLTEKQQTILSREMIFLETMRNIFDTMLQNTSENYICVANIVWDQQVLLEYTFLNPWKYLQSKLWKKVKSCVLTSATLQTSHSYDYISNILHLEDFSFLTLKTDFDYKKQALLYMPNDLWNIKNNAPQTIEFLRKLFLAAGWNILVLFTAFAMIKETYTTLDYEMKQEWIQLFAQSIGWWKQKLIDFFIENANSSVLIWTNTFWEWIDIPWDTLKYLVIHKIPFAVPSDPIFQARSVLYKDAFAEYSIPKSILKLKQWFGRLIRSKTDSGIVIFLDNRIQDSAWWKEFYSAFPEDIPKRIDSSENFLSIIEKRKSQTK